MKVKELSFFLKTEYLEAYKYPLKNPAGLDPYTAVSWVDVMSNSEYEMWWLRRLNRHTVLSCSENGPEWTLQGMTLLWRVRIAHAPWSTPRQLPLLWYVMASFIPWQERTASLHRELQSRSLWQRSHRTWHSGWWQRTQENSSPALQEMLQRSHVRWGPRGHWGPDPGILLTCLRDSCCSNLSP